MIPWKMRFSGIRDYEATLMDLSGQQEHVLITGPNGAGKSTITYCMGAVLYSSKVEVEGLRSRNLGADERWKAQIHFLFKNEGYMRIDAPDYVEFSLYLLQEPGQGQPIKKEFVISSGDDPLNWEEEIHYTSGDRQYNFTAYKKDLQYKYKIDPDLFYLIWYQQEVNQFSVMHPEERFRIFAEMHGIDRVQKNWEESIEKLKETQETLRVAEGNVANKKLMLKIKKSELDRYEDNQRRLLEGGRLYAGSLLQLEGFYKREQEQLIGLIDQLELDKEEQQEQMHETKVQQTVASEQIAGIQKNMNELQSQLSHYDGLIQALDLKRKETGRIVDELEQELKEVIKEKERITRTEEEVKEQLESVTLQLSGVLEQEDDIKMGLGKGEEENQALIRVISSIEAEIQQDQKLEAVHQERIRQYITSHHVQEELNRLEELLSYTKDTRNKHSSQIGDLEEELARLEEEHDWSRRQIESLNYFSSKGIRAYALRELVELDHSAQLKSEERFNSIKYSIFFDGHVVIPPNDLYHVPLRKVVPDRSVTELASLQLRVKEGLDEEVLPHAMKALWWIEQFFKDGDIRIEHGVLVDAMGIRGPQEQHRYIMSARALFARKEEAMKSIRTLTHQCEEADEKIKLNTKRLQELNGIIHLVREAEAFMTREHERISRANKHTEEVAKLSQLQKHMGELREVQLELMKKRLKMERDQNELQSEAEFYVRIGQQKEKYEVLKITQRELASLDDKLEELQRQEKLSEESWNKLDKDARRQGRVLQEIQDQYEREESKLRQIINQLQSRNDSLEDVKREYILSIKEIEEFKQLAPHIYNEVTNSNNLQSGGGNATSTQGMTIANIRSSLESGRVQFNHARQETGIDPAAPDNYKVVEEEFYRYQDEYKRTSLLFEQDQERTEQLRDQLETTIQMRVLEIEKRFESYMSLFQFEGKIEWDQHEGRQGRIHFNLFIKARKEGHRGTMEDVSVKARGGRVGKGVSGGEESLSSLLFALALLQNLQTAPGFIVMDEFDSALDEQRKLKVFDLYQQELKRKLIILTPKSHEKSYLDLFSKAYIVHHDPRVPRSKATGLKRKI
ncbi:chromosome segregation protein SMC [Paenibacillus sp. SN-8-1]|uniref:chromosome segregation protein SMC n=1 Tax=Paenibacillus sp. SN-8-1 TaxID=3435409 RepID=UPI003D9A75A3